MIYALKWRSGCGFVPGELALMLDWYAGMLACADCGQCGRVCVRGAGLSGGQCAAQPRAPIYCTARAKMVNGVIKFCAPQDCTMRRDVREMKAKAFGGKYGNFTGLDEASLREEGGDTAHGLDTETL